MGYILTMNNSEEGRFLVDYQFIDSPLVLGGIGVYQIGKKFCDSDTLSPPHLHMDWYELTVANAGKGVITTEGVPQVIESGDIYLSFPYEIHSVQSSSENRLTYTFFSFYFKDEKYKEAFDKLALSFGESSSRVFRNALIPPLIDILIMEIADGNEKSRLSELTLEQLALLVLKFCAPQKTPFLAEAKNGDQLVFMTMRYVSLNLLSIKDLSEIAARLGYNYSYLSKVFKEKTGNTITEYFLSAKMERAKTLLEQNSLSVSAVADTLGYASVYSFSKAFKKFFGVSPSRYKSHASPLSLDKRGK